MHKNKFVIVADDFNVKSKFPLISVFPKNVDVKRKRLNYKQIKLQHLKSINYCSKFSNIIDKFYKDNVLDENNLSLKKIFYPYTFIILNSFLSIFVKVRMSLNDYKRKNIVTTGDFNLPKIQYLNELKSCIISDWNFNQILVSRIARSLGISKSIDINELEFINVNKNYNNFTSYSFISNKLDLKLKNILARVSNLLRKINFRNKNVFLSIGFAHMDYYLGLKGVYGPFGYLKESCHVLSQNITKDEIKRELLKKKI